MGDIYDLIILGGGPAGITAYVYAARKRLHFLLISQDIGGQAAWSGDVENYTGFQFVTGPELAAKFEEHMKTFQADLKLPETVKDIQKSGDVITVETDKGQYRAYAVIIATGKRPRPLGVEGEEKFKNRGVTYCATCDGPLFRDKPVAVIGGGNSGLDAALQMVKLCPKVYLVNTAPKCTGDPVMSEKVKSAPNVEIWNGTQVRRILGEKFVSGIEVEKDGRRHTLDVQGVFVEIGLIPNSDFASLLQKNGQGEIIVDCYNKTSVEGIFAAGDVTNVPEKQIIISCGEGAKACLSVFHYLSTHEFK